MGSVELAADIFLARSIFPTNIFRRNDAFFCPNDETFNAGRVVHNAGSVKHHAKSVKQKAKSADKLAKTKPSKEAGGKAFGLRLKTREAAGVILPTAASLQPPALSIPVVTQLETQIALLEEQNALLPVQRGMSREQLAVRSSRLGVRAGVVI